VSGTTVLPEPHRILIVEDDAGCRTLLDTIFRVNGFVVTSTDSVLGATELIERFQPNVILLDLGLPYRSGASWLAQLKADTGTAHIPVVVLTAVPESLPQSRRQLAHDVIAKPFRGQPLVETVRAACRLDAGAANGVRGDSASSQRLGSL
jgi:two-component system, OmpR family, alkaline phosphatase synthesis response regulator PhoP